MRLLVPIVAAVLTLACGGEAVPAHPNAEKPAEPPAATAPDVKPSPEVLALLEPDPDLEGAIRPEEVRAALDAAKQPPVAERRVARAAEPPPAAPAGSEWSELEKEKRRKQEARESELASTTVYLASGDSFWYHTSGCEELYRYFFDRDKVLHRIYIGRPITLKQAADARITAHAACGAPGI